MGLNINMHGMFPIKDAIWTKIKAARGIKRAV